MSATRKLGFAAVALLGITYLNDNVLPASASGEASADPIPPAYLALYEQAANTCPSLDWSLLAAVGKVETNHGRAKMAGVLSGANSAGAEGPMQFLASTSASSASLSAATPTPTCARAPPRSARSSAPPAPPTTAPNKSTRRPDRKQ
jgi:hypothetical protein